MVDTLDEDDRELLERIRSGSRTPRELAADDDREHRGIETRLEELVDDGVVRRADDGSYRLSASGERLLNVPPEDRKATVREESQPDPTIAALDLPPDAEAALSRTVAFVRYWDAATSSEIIDGVYSEAAAGYDDPRTWWEDLVRDRLAALPDIVPPTEEDTLWRYQPRDTANTAESNGREVLGTGGDHYGSAKHAIEREASPQEYQLASDIFYALVNTGHLTDEAIERYVSVNADASISPSRFEDILSTVPGVVRDGDEWRYEQ